MSHPLSVALRQNVTVPHAAYQVDFISVNCGKIVPASKRRICFKFGYTNADALSDGKTGQGCRGSEHEIIVTWSLSSGKQAISFDQHEIFFDVGDSTQTKFSHSWEDKFGHCLEVKIHAASMSTKVNHDPNWKQYDLLINGVSFFVMPKIFEIGVFPREDAAASLALKSNFAPCPYGASPNAPTERFNLSTNNIDFLLTEELKTPEQKPPEVVDLLSFDEFDHPVPAVTTLTADPAPVQTIHAPAQVAAQTYHDPAEVPTQTNNAQYYLGDTNCISPASGNVQSKPVQDSSAYHLNTSLSQTMTSQSNPTPVTPPGEMQNLINTDRLFCVTAASPVTKEYCDDHKSLGHLHGGKYKSEKPVMNPFISEPVCSQQGILRNEFATATQPLRQRQYDGHTLQQASTQPGFGYQSRAAL